MVDCYDCIHCGACSDAGDSGFSSLKEDASECIHYKNKEDVVEVVRCKDCRYYEIGKSYTPYCNNVMNLFEEMKPTDFCSYGERKGGAEE